jgi:hypothetical protein
MRINGIIEDVRIDNDRIYEFTVDESGQLWFDIDISGDGIIIGIIVQDIYGYTIYSGVGYYVSQRIGLGLLDGNYSITFLFFTDMESIRDFLIYTDVYDITESDTFTFYNDIISNNKDNFFVEYSLIIR